MSADERPERNASRWANYYKIREGGQPRETVLKALALYGDESGQAIDLGCGNGNDTLALLEAGWHVLAIDGQAEAIERVRANTPAEWRPRLQTQVAMFETLTLPPADLINASFALPFCPPEYFTRFGGQIVGSIRPHGRFAGQLFGNKDSWAGRPEMTCHTRAQVDELLAGFEIEFLVEDYDPDGRTAVGNPKHWHIYRIVARKRG
ncbi:MAG: class I SAM-dependent methyltransferase [Anaerolineales bacterium]|nr:class I SAM-dependent methyltransferase [Anaerolineales bacterium]